MADKPESLDGQLRAANSEPGPGYKADARPLYYFGELARAYVPPQTYGERLSPEKGLKRGTIFPELYSPY